MQNGLVDSFNCRMRAELLNGSLSLGLDHARSLLAAWVENFNTRQPHPSLGYQTPTEFATTIMATGSGTPLSDGSAPTLVARSAPYGIAKTDEL